MVHDMLRTHCALHVVHLLPRAFTMVGCGVCVHAMCVCEPRHVVQNIQSSTYMQHIYKWVWDTHAADTHTFYVVASNGARMAPHLAYTHITHTQSQSTLNPYILYMLYIWYAYICQQISFKKLLNRTLQLQNHVCVWVFLRKDTLWLPYSSKWSLKV